MRTEWKERTRTTADWQTLSKWWNKVKEIRWAEWAVGGRGTKGNWGAPRDARTSLFSAAASVQEAANRAWRQWMVASNRYRYRSPLVTIKSNGGGDCCRLLPKHGRPCNPTKCATTDGILQNHRMPPIKMSPTMPPPEERGLRLRLPASKHDMKKRRPPAASSRLLPQPLHLSIPYSKVER